MTDRAPDPDGLRYARYWEPVLAPPAHRLLERIDGQPTDYLDVGAGTGGLVLAARERWPAARITGLDASEAMLSVARQRMAERDGDDIDGLRWLAADAAELPLDDESVDVATSLFMLQLVAERDAVLAEIRRVLRPGGAFGLVTWLTDDLSMAADDAFAAVVAELAPDADDPGFRHARATDYESLEEVDQELSAAGFVDIDARLDELHQAWTQEAYLEFKEHFDERDVFDSLDVMGRERLRSAVRSRWAGLPESAFEVRGPLVSAVARRPGA